MKLTWVIERYIYDNNDNCQNELDLRNEITNQGYQVKIIDPVRFDWRDIAHLIGREESHPVIFRGSLNIGTELKKSTNWTPGVICTPSELKHSTYAAYWGEHLLNEEYFIMALGEVIRRKEFLTGYFRNTKVFIKPDSVFKEFAGRIYDLYEVEDKLSGLTPCTQVVVAPIKEITKEWRFIVAGSLVISGSLYAENGEYVSSSRSEQDYMYSVVGQNCYIEAKQYLQNCIRNLPPWQPDLVYCVDICETSTGKLKVLELNSFSCSNLYFAELSKVVKEVSKLAIAEWEEQ